MTDYLDEIITEGGLRQEAKRWWDKAETAEALLVEASKILREFQSNHCGLYCDEKDKKFPHTEDCTEARTFFTKLDKRAKL